MSDDRLNPSEIAIVFVRPSQGPPTRKISNPIQYDLSIIYCRSGHWESQEIFIVPESGTTLRDSEFYELEHLIHIM